MTPVPFQITVDPEQVNAAVAAAVLNSVIGEAMKAAVEKNVADLTKRYDSPVEKAVAGVILDEVKRLVHVEHAAAVAAQVRAYITPERVAELMDKMWERTLRNI
jgi:NADH dehydrogenase/NADH:ubiquinone oxidoreductase subunit G